MTSSEDETIMHESLEGFVEIIKHYPIIFEKSMLPETRKRKMDAMIHIRSRYESKFGVRLTDGQLTKKIFNMRSRLRNKTDLKRTGNKTIILKDWEKQLYGLMQGESNPTINQVQGEVIIIFIIIKTCELCIQLHYY